MTPEQRFATLQLHEIAKIRTPTKDGSFVFTVLKVEGGWIYHFVNSSVFVPYPPNEVNGE